MFHQHLPDSNGDYSVPRFLSTPLKVVNNVQFNNTMAPNLNKALISINSIILNLKYGKGKNPKDQEWWNDKITEKTLWEIEKVFQGKFELKWRFQVILKKSEQRLRIRNIFWSSFKSTSIAIQNITHSTWKTFSRLALPGFPATFLDILLYLPCYHSLFKFLWKYSNTFSSISSSSSPFEYLQKPLKSQ